MSSTPSRREAHIYRSAASLRACGSTPPTRARRGAACAHAARYAWSCATIQVSWRELNASIASRSGAAIPRDEHGRRQARTASIKVFGERLKPIRQRVSCGRAQPRERHRPRDEGRGRALRFTCAPEVTRSQRRLLVCTARRGLFVDPGMAAHRMVPAVQHRRGSRCGSGPVWAHVFEYRFIPLRIKDALAPTGEIARTGAIDQRAQALRSTTHRRQRMARRIASTRRCSSAVPDAGPATSICAG